MINEKENIEDYDNVKDYIIFYYEKLLENSIKYENYEDSGKYKKWIDELKINKN